jgi:hypothetical protein
MHTTPNGKKYIGITCKKPQYRWSNGNGYRPNRYFYNAIKKYGWENIKHEILFTGLSKKDAEQKEIELIAKYKSNQFEFGYNHSLGGECKAFGCHWTLSDETKKKLSEVHKGKITWNKGIKMTNEMRKILNEARYSQVFCVETGIAYRSLKEAEEKTGIKYQLISRVCRKQRKTAGGYHWEYCNETF